MLENFTEIGTDKFNRGVLAASFSIALATVSVLSIPAVQAAYEYSPHSTMPEAGIRIALKDATIGGATAIPRMGDDLDIFKATIKDRRTRLSSVIAAGQSTGRLTVEQADTLRSELDSLNGIDRHLNGKTPPSYAYLLQLANHYDGIQARIDSFMTTYELRMIPTDPGAVLIGDKTVNLDAGMKRRAVLEDKISRDISKGQVTGQDGARLRNMLNALAVKESNLRKTASAGALKPNEKTEVDSGLAKVTAALNSSVNM